jgi:N-acetylglutamate synthase-like GNAT family acetyltransferase
VLRVATRDDIPAIDALIRRSVHGLMGEYLDPAQMQIALGTVLGVDPTLIDDGTYFVVEDGGAMVGAGGWSRRATLYGVPTGNPRALDPATENARLRAFFVDPAVTKRGIATLILDRAEHDARAAGFRVIELMATPTGIAFYERRAYETVENKPIELPDGSSMPGRVMRKSL